MSVKHDRLTRIQAIRAKCLECSNDSRKEIRECPIQTCPLYPFRMGKRPSRAEAKFTASKAIRKECLECYCGNKVGVRECKRGDCTLWIYRMGYEVDYNGDRIKHKED